MSSQTPMERQYALLKQEAGDALLFFRVGDFYEMFHADAQQAAEILEIALTSRNKNVEHSVPMCGVPIKAADRYIAKLTAAGLKVAIAEQVSDPGLAGIVDRKIVSIITPGTTLSDQILETGKSRFLGALHQEKEIFYLSLCEVSTGQLLLQKSSSLETLLQDICAKEVAEIVFSPALFSEISSKFTYFSGSITRHFPPENPSVFLQSFFGIQTLKSFGIENDECWQKTIALLFSYLEETQKMPMRHVSDIQWIKEHAHVQMDYSTIANLELFSGTDGNARHGLLAMIDYTKTPMGSRMLRQWFLSPLRDKNLIDERLMLIDGLLFDPDLKASIEKAFALVSDIERILGKISLRRATPHDALRLAKSLEAIQSLLPVFSAIPPTHPWHAFAQEIITLFS